MNIQATLFAWKHGIPTLENLGKWNGYEVFAPSFTAETGTTKNVILANATGARFADPAEAGSCLAAIAS